jgi:dipeptidyl aminopeptidase/acylaminoacyl peptidase
MAYRNFGDASLPISNGSLPSRGPASSLGRENSEVWWTTALDRSCSTFVANIAADLLVVHEQEDESVPLGSAEELVKAAKARAKGTTDF